MVSPSGGLDKLEAWWRLGVQEVWCWDRADRLQIFVRGADGFEPAARSVLVAGVDPALISTCMDEPRSPPPSRCCGSARADRAPEPSRLRARRLPSHEPDECYVFPPIPHRDEVERPDLVLEVVYSSGGLDKLEVGWRLGAKEVWFRDREDRLQLFVRSAERFERAPRSAIVPDVDPDLISRCMDEPTQSAAVKALSAALRCAALR